MGGASGTSVGGGGCRSGGPRSECNDMVGGPRVNPGNYGDIIHTIYDVLVVPSMSNEEGACRYGKLERSERREGRHPAV